MADRREAKSKYTADRGIPGAFEGETVTRRRFMTGTVHLTGAVATAAFVLPALGFALGPLFEKHEQPWQAIGPPSDFNETTYIPKTITIVQGIGQAGKSTVYVRKRNPQIDKEPQDQYNTFVAISTRCMLPSCPVRFVQAAGRFICPCRGGGLLPGPRRVHDLPGGGLRGAASPSARPLLHPRPQQPARDRTTLLG